jgi:esterase/lipase superfamily enzyme
VFLAAPDVDLDVFNRLAKAYPRVSKRTTLYVSEKDAAVKFSEGDLVHDYARAGSPPPFPLVAGVETVNVRAGRGLFDFGHAFVAEFEPVLDDMRSLILQNTPHALRKPSDSGAYWVLEQK